MTPLPKNSKLSFWITTKPKPAYRGYAVVNPKRLDENNNHPDLAYMAAVGVVFMTVVAINRILRQKGFYTSALPEPNLMQWLDLVALGTVCDVVTLLGINRSFVTQGLKIMSSRQNLGLRTLADAANINEKPDAYHLGFVLGPRINAGGRVGKASIGSRLLCSVNPMEAKQLADELNGFNQERKDIEGFVLEQSIEMLEGTPQSWPMAFVYNKGWHQGVIGIVAGKLKERYNLPAFVMSIEDDEVKGSARSIPGVDLGALIIAAKEKGVLTKGGGHTMAAGFSLTEAQIPAFRTFAGEYIARSLNNTRPHPVINIDLSLSLPAANAGLCSELERLNLSAPATLNLFSCCAAYIFNAPASSAPDILNANWHPYPGKNSPPSLSVLPTAKSAKKY